MDVYIARQPIFDRQMRIYGYELLYRKSDENAFTEMDDDIATSELIYNSFLVAGLNKLTDGTKAFINFSKDLIDSKLPYLLPKDSVVFEILERKEATEATIEACDRLKALGYELALDDFVIDDSFLPLFDKVDIIKVEYPSVSLEDQSRLVKENRNGTRFLAEKIETREDFQHAFDIGYDFFQGYFFSKPTIINSKEIASISANIIAIADELKNPEPSYDVISEIIMSDLGLTYKLLSLANSVYMGARGKIRSVKQALSYIGINEMNQWINIMMVRDLQNVENAELVKLSLIRGKFLELLAKELKYTDKASECFLTGMFSFIDVLMNKPMGEVLEGLPL
ncbi:MAG: HDOD domain-containing protein [Oscillospiraceae bacterium]|nr:HDOD domain-containing protein [Oscillospiraceae bacterium]